jgi:hypothetical protein
MFKAYFGVIGLCNPCGGVLCVPCIEPKVYKINIERTRKSS